MQTIKFIVAAEPKIQTLTNKYNYITNKCHKHFKSKKKVSCNK